VFRSSEGLVEDLTLTEAGKVFTREAEASLRLFQAAQLSAQRAARGEAGTLVLGFQSTAGLLTVPRLLHRFRTASPEVEIILREMGTNAQRIALRGAELDAALIYAPSDDEFASHKLTPEPLLIAMPDNHPLAERDSVAFSELAHERFILPSREVAEGLYYSILAECTENGFRPVGLQEVSTAQTALGLVAAYVGISVLPSSVRVLSRDGVVMKNIRNSRIQAQLELVWPKVSPSPIVERLLGHLD
jgi:DNA-binding transcriptional LysR family regulator